MTVDKTLHGFNKRFMQENRLLFDGEKPWFPVPVTLDLKALGHRAALQSCPELPGDRGVSACHDLHICKYCKDNK